MVTIPTIDQISGTTVMNKMRSLINNYIDFGTEVAGEISYMMNVVENLPQDITDVYNKATIDGMFAAVSAEFNNYYTKSVVYTKTEVNSLISTIGSFHAVVVDELPEYGEQGIIYLLQIAESGDNIYKEYIWVNRWELIGQLSDIDLDDYYTKDESDTKFIEKDENLIDGESLVWDATNSKAITQSIPSAISTALADKGIKNVVYSDLVTGQTLTPGTITNYCNLNIPSGTYLFSINTSSQSVNNGRIIVGININNSLGWLNNLSANGDGVYSTTCIVTSSGTAMNVKVSLFSSSDSVTGLGVGLNVVKLL